MKIIFQLLKYYISYFLATNSSNNVSASASTTSVDSPTQKSSTANLV